MTAATPALSHLSFTGTLMQNAHVRQVMCDKRGHMRPAVCMLVKVHADRPPMHVKQFCKDGSAADVCAKTLRKGAVIELHAPINEIHMSANADFIEVQTPAPEPAAKPVSVDTNPQEPELNF